MPAPAASSSPCSGWTTLPRCHLPWFARGEVESVGPDWHFIVRAADGHTLDEKHWPGAEADHRALLGSLLAWVEGHLGTDRLAAVGHLVVHGGRAFSAPVRLCDRLKWMGVAMDRLANNQGADLISWSSGAIPGLSVEVASDPDR